MLPAPQHMLCLTARTPTACQSTAVIIGLTELHLQDAMVRHTAVTALLELYRDEDNVEPMHELTTRFAPRFAQLIHDIDEGVAVKGVSASLMIAECHQSLHHKSDLRKQGADLYSTRHHDRLLCTKKPAEV